MKTLRQSRNQSNAELNSAVAQNFILQNRPRESGPPGFATSAECNPVPRLREQIANLRYMTRGVVPASRRQTKSTALVSLIG